MYVYSKFKLPEPYIYSMDSSDDSIIDRLDLIPEEFDVEKSDENELNVPTE